MNILLIYPELPLSFWSMPQAIQFGPAKALFAPLGPLTLAALFPQDWHTSFVDLNITSIRENEWQKADIVMISGMFVQAEGFKKIINEAKQRSKITVAGGPYPTLCADELIEAGCDYVVCGEAENAITPLMNALESGERGKIITMDSKPDLTTTPIPRYDLINVYDYQSFLIQTTRGCPFSCEFCDIEGLYGKQPRYRKPEQIIEELDYIFQQGIRGIVMIADDNFIASKKNAKAICRKIIQWNQENGSPFDFLTQTSVNLGQDMEMIDLMTAANFSAVFIGIESPDEEILKASNKHHNVNSPLLESIENIKKNGLSIIGSIIIGFDNEKKGIGKRICEFVDKTSISSIMPNILCAPPGTKLKERLQREGRLHENITRNMTGNAYFTLPNFTPDRPLEEIIEEYIEIWEHLYYPPNFFKRSYDFCLAMRPTRKTMAIEKGTPVQQSTVPRARPCFRQQTGDILRFLFHVWKHGIAAPHRVQFWKQLHGMKKQNPSRLKKYIIHCIRGDFHMDIVKTIRRDTYKLLAEYKKENPNP